MPKYGTLKRNHRDYDPRRITELSDLYEGGYRILERASKYLPQLLNEHDEVYKQRCQLASYLPYMGQIVDQLTAWLFADTLTITPPPDANNPKSPGELPDKDFWPTFASDADRNGTTFADCVRGVVSQALLQGRGWIGVDFPRLEAPKKDDPSAETEQVIQNRAAEKALGVDRAYLYEVPVECVTNWARDTKGRLLWAIVYSKDTPQLDPLQENLKIVEEWKVWRVGEGTDVKASWELFRVEYEPDEPPDDDDDVPSVDSGETTFDEIPLLELRLPKGLCVGEKIGPLCKEHFQRRNALVAAEYQSIGEVAVIKLGPEIGGPGDAMPAEAQQNPNRGVDAATQYKSKGWTVIGSQDEFEFKGPSGRSFELVDRELMSLKDEIFRVVHLMAASVGNSTAQMGRSGISKAQDKLDTAIVLGALGTHVRKFGVSIYDLIARARSEDVRWRAMGLDEFETEDRATLVEEALQMDSIQIPSETWKAHYKQRIALKLAEDMPAETQEVVRQEILAGVAEEFEHAQLMKEAALNGALNGGDDEGEQQEGTEARPPHIGGVITAPRKVSPNGPANGAGGRGKPRGRAS